jgi:type I restriction enzyme, S subunit
VNNSWPLVSLGEVLAKSEQWIDLDPETTYREITVRLWGKGVELRREVTGAEIASSRRLQVKAGQFILSRIDARNGALGLVPHSLDGAVVSNDFPVFTPNPSRILPSFLGWMSRTQTFVALCKAASEGTTNRVRLQEERFLSMELPLPPPPEQRRIVARIEELTAKINEARKLRRQAAEEAEVLIRSAVTRIDKEQRRQYSVAKLEDFASRESNALRSGPFGSALLHSEFVAEGIPAIGIQDVQENRFELSRRWNVTPEKAEELRRYSIKRGDILVTVMGTLGRACVIPDDAPRMVSTKHVWTVTLDPSKAEPKWISYWLNFSGVVRDELLGQGTGTAIPGLNGEKIRAVSLPDIPVTKQHRIVSELDTLQAQLDALKKLQAESAAELDALLPSILDRAFTGNL